MVVVVVVVVEGNVGGKAEDVESSSEMRGSLEKANILLSSFLYRHIAAMQTEHTFH